MSGEIVASLAVGVALAGLNLTSSHALRAEVATIRSDLTQIRGELASLRERMAHLEGLLEGLREAISGRVGTGA